MTETIVVLAATGKTGRRVVSRLRDAGKTVRAVSRSSQTRFDWTDQSTWAGALDGASAVYLVAPDEAGPVREFVGQAVAAGVRRLVALSGRGAELMGDNGMADAETVVRESGVDWTILRPNNFSQNFTEDLWFQPMLDGELGLPVGDAVEPFIDVDDIAEVAAVALTQDGHAGQSYDLSGPRALNFTEAVELISKASGRQIRFVDQTPEEYVAAQVAAGLPVEFAEYLAEIYAVLRSGRSAEPTDAVRRVLGREAGDFESYVLRNAGAWTT